MTVPTLPLRALDVLWLQVTGTRCNIACRHCFVTAGPKSTSIAVMPTADVERALTDGERLGVREVWFTGGEPFLHPDIVRLVDAALARAPLGILTNGMLIDDDLAAALGERFRTAPHSLELRVSLDGPDAASNDAVRGKGVFDATCAGIARLAAHGLLPIVAVTRLDDHPVQREDFVALLRDLGVPRPRIKWIPPFRIGREARRGRDYADHERITPEDLQGDAAWVLQCGTGRTVTADGVFPCPILVEARDRRLAATLDDALVPIPVDHPACHTCLVEGFSCST